MSRGFPRQFSAIWDKNISGFRTVFSPPLSFSTPLINLSLASSGGDDSTAAKPVLLSLRRCFVSCTPEGADKLLFRPIALLSKSLEYRTVGSSFAPLLEICIFETSPTILSASPIGLNYVAPPKNESASVRYFGSNTLQSITFQFAEFSSNGTLHLDDQAEFFSILQSTIQFGFLEILCF